MVIFNYIVRSHIDIKDFGSKYSLVNCNQNLIAGLQIFEIRVDKDCRRRAFEKSQNKLSHWMTCINGHPHLSSPISSPRQ